MRPARPARRLIWIVFVVLGLLWPAGSALAQSPSAEPEGRTPIVVLQVEGAIDRTLIGYLDERLDQAEEDGAIVVLQLDTSGTLDENGVALADRIANLSVPVISWTGPAPARAAGAGLLLMYASSLAAVGPGTATGPLVPIDLAHPSATPPGLQGEIEGWLESRDKDTDPAPVTGELTAQEALDVKIAQVAALSVPDLLDKIDGRTVQTPGGPVTLETKIARGTDEAPTTGVNVRFDNLGPIDRLLHAVSTPTMVYLLLVLGLAGLAFEVTQPGFGFAGFMGVALLALAAYGIWVVPFSWVGMALLLGGIAMMTLDVRLRRLSALTFAGLIAFGAGSFMTWSGLAPALRISPWLIGGFIVASLLYYGFALTVALQSRDRIVTAQRGLIGLVGEARGRLAPEGPVYVKGAMWRGRARGDAIDQGARIRVRGVDGLVLEVEREPEPTPP